jgi:hypothetical protein
MRTSPRLGAEPHVELAVGESREESLEEHPPKQKTSVVGSALWPRGKNLRRVLTVRDLGTVPTNFFFPQWCRGAADCN